MPSKLNLTTLKQSIRQFFIEKGQTLKGVATAMGPLGHRAEGGPDLKVLHVFQLLKKYLPAIIITLILITGLIIGKRIASQYNQSIDIPKPAPLPTTITPPSSSDLSLLKQFIIQFNPSLPDPLIPEFNDKIFIEELPD